jgi:hypothetical protein
LIGERSVPRLRSSTLFGAGALLVGLALMLAMAIAAIGAGPWYDEFFTLAVTDMDESVFRLLRDHWMADNHPPLFYALAWATQWLGSQAEPRRLVNLAFFGLAAWGLLRLARRGRDTRVLLGIYAMVLASSFPAIEKAAELRSNFLALTAATLAIAALVLRSPAAEDAVRRIDWPLTLVLALAFNVHFTTTLIVGSVVVAFVVQCVLARDWQGARCLVLAASIAALPMMITTLLQAATISANTHSFWIPAGFTAARWAVQEAATDAMKANLPATLAGCAGLLLVARNGGRAAGDIGHPVGIVVALAGGTALALAIMLAVHAWRPIVMARYLIALYPVSAMILAIGTAALVRNADRKVGLTVAVLVPVVALVAIANNLSQTLTRKSWYDTGRAIQKVLRACPQSTIHAAMVWNRPVMAMPPADNRAAMPLSYATVARRMGFAIAPAQSRQMSAPCPTVFWTEHVANERPKPEEVKQILRGEGFPVGEARLLRYGRGWIILASKVD